MFICNYRVVSWLFQKEKPQNQSATCVVRIMPLVPLRIRNAQIAAKPSGHIIFVTLAASMMAVK